MLAVKALPGTKDAVLVAAFRLTVPTSADSPAPTTVKLEVVIVVAFIAVLKVAVTVLLVGTPVSALAGLVDMTVGVAPLGLPLALSSSSLQPATNVVSSNAASHKDRREDL